MKISRERVVDEGVQNVLAIITRLQLNLRDEILRYALVGDWAPLAKYIRGGGRVTPPHAPVSCRRFGRDEKAPSCESKQVGNEAKKG